jgi:hypothetical protein
MQKKYKWNDRTVEQIDWFVHGRALKGLPPTMKKTTIQCIHKWLPTNAHPGRAHPEQQQVCLLCETEAETNTHYLECNHPEATKYWTDSIPKLKEMMKKRNTDPVLQELLISAVTEWRTTESPEPTKYIPRKYRAMFEEQTQIGWTHVLKGRLSIKWVQLHEYLRSKDLPEAGENWAIGIMKGIWMTHYHYWKRRSKIQHGDIPANALAKKRVTLTSQIHNLYRHKEHLDSYDRAILNRPVSELLKESVSYLEKNGS